MEPKMVTIQDDRNDSYLRAIKTNCDPATNMVICVLPNDKKVGHFHLYISTVKKNIVLKLTNLCLARSLQKFYFSCQNLP